ncbi:MAG: 4'-phosphopantetheinyl transferase superfamily protein [Cyclobacteriaceae bacterium]
MIGIDIFDRSDERTKKRSLADLRFILADDEVAFDNPNIFWLYWTAKEAVFKASRNPNSPFFPKKISITFEEKSLQFSSKYDGLIFQGQCLLTNDYIMSYCQLPHLKTIYEVIHNGIKNWSEHIRSIATSDLQNTDENLKITTDADGLPMISNVNLPICFSHHHHHGAYIYPLWHR